MTQHGVRPAWARLEAARGRLAALRDRFTARPRQTWDDLEREAQAFLERCREERVQGADPEVAVVLERQVLTLAVGVITILAADLPSAAYRDPVLRAELARLRGLLRLMVEGMAMVADE